MATSIVTARHPTVVARLVLEEPPFQMFSHMTPDATQAFQRVGQLAGEGRLRDASEAFLRYAMSYRTGGTAFDTLPPAVRQALLANAGALMAELQAGPVEEVSPERVRAITCPATCVVGELTPEALVSATERLVRLLPQAHVVRIADAAHAIHVDQPERFIAAVRSALS
jgi:pimeloyl-ACP methyl ester carboxylesterase